MADEQLVGEFQSTLIHPAHLYQAAMVACQKISLSALSQREKRYWYGRIDDAIGILIEGIAIKVDEDGAYVFPSRPGKKRDPNERHGHRIIDNTCSCKAGEHGRACWARAALRLIQIDESLPNRLELGSDESEELFPDEGEGESL